MNHNLNEMQQDAIGELLNIGLGQAAATFSEQVQQEVLLSIPNISFYTLQEAATVLEQMTGSEACLVTQTFSGPIWGDALLALTPQDSLEIIEILLPPHTEQERRQQEAEVLTHIGTLILSTTLKSLQSLFPDPIKMGKKQFKKGAVYTLLNESTTTFHYKTGTALVLCMSLTLAKKKQSFYISIIMNHEALQALKTDLDHLLNLV
ncbi:MAG: hypothetical protein Q9O24_13855 [Gammaproteobacteria bacterium]|nr:hypothetical protein [Gammaproteobacteria bacterium]